MFTGIIEEIGKIKNIVRGARSISLEIEATKILEGTKIGDSIATNGVCLTVTSVAEHVFRADVMPETMRMSNLKLLNVGDGVHLERALTLSARLGGHLVAGHVDGTGRIVAVDKEDTAVWLTVSAETKVLRYIVNKGSVAIDGVSLTVASIDEATFKVSVIPHTQQETLLITRRTGDIVNIENDMMVRFVEKLMGKKETTGMSLTYLLENGF
ncbi:riboflavin synthase subunit alpha [Bacteroidia bacterium]|nr:riboflavin synthase subunit alpha [Bacteroidia bacterium]